MANKLTPQDKRDMLIGRKLKKATQQIQELMDQLESAQIYLFGEKLEKLQKYQAEIESIVNSIGKEFFYQIRNYETKKYYADDLSEQEED